MHRLPSARRARRARPLGHAGWRSSRRQAPPPAQGQGQTRAARAQGGRGERQGQARRGTAQQLPQGTGIDCRARADRRHGTAGEARARHRRRAADAAAARRPPTTRAATRSASWPPATTTSRRSKNGFVDARVRPAAPAAAGHAGHARRRAGGGERRSPPHARRRHHRPRPRRGRRSAARALVTVQRYQYVGGERQLRPAGGDQTDDRGQYRVFGLPPGEYYVSAIDAADSAS